MGNGFLALTAIAILCAYLINNFYSFSPILKDVLQLFGFSFTFAALGKRGIQTWGGESPAEKLNERIFLVLSFAGVFLIIFSH